MFGIQCGLDLFGYLDDLLIVPFDLFFQKFPVHLLHGLIRHGKGFFIDG